MNTLRQFLKQYDKAVKFQAVHPLPIPKQEIAFTLLKDEIFAHHYQDIKEHYNRQIGLSFRFERNKECCFSIKKFQNVGEFQQRLSIYDIAKCIAFTKIVTILPQSVEFLMAILIFDSNILSQVLYQDQNVVQLIGDVICPNNKCRGENCVNSTSFEEINKSIYQCKQCKACSHVLNFAFEDQKPCLTLFGLTYCFRKKTKSDYQKEKLSPLMRQYIRQSKFSTTNAEEANIKLVPKKRRYYHIWINRITLLLVVLLQHKFTFLFIFKTFLKLTTRSVTINTMQFTVYNNGTQWILDFGTDSVVLSVKDVDENLTISSLDFPLAAWSLMLSQRQEFLDNHLPRVPITPNQQGTFEMREEVLSSDGAQDTDSRGYELSDLEDIQFSWKDLAVDMDSVYRPRIDTPLSTSIFDVFQME